MRYLNINFRLNNKNWLRHPHRFIAAHAMALKGSQMTIINTIEAFSE